MSFAEIFERLNRSSSTSAMRISDEADENEATRCSGGDDVAAAPAWGEESDNESTFESDPVRRAFDDLLKRLSNGEFPMDDNGAQAVKRDYRRYLTSKTEEAESNIMHTLAAVPVPNKEHHRWLVQFLVKQYPVLMEETDGHGRTPLCIAITRKKKAQVVVRSFWEALKDMDPDWFDKILAMKLDDTGHNCIHAAILRELPPIAITSLVQGAKQETLSAQDAKGRTPLHYAVEYSRCSGSRLAVVKELLARGDTALERFTIEPDCFSVFQHHNQTRLVRREEEDRENDAGRPESPGSAASDKELAAAASGGRAALASHEVGTRGRDRLDTSKSRDVSVGLPGSDRTIMSGATALKMASSDGRSGKPSAPPTPTEPSPGVLRRRATAERSRELRGKAAVHGSGSTVTAESVDAIRDELRMHYLRSTFGLRNHDMAIRFLFGPTTEFQIFFDFSKRPDAIQEAEFVESFDHIRFYDVLQYVSFNPVYLLPRPVRENSRFAHLMTKTQPRRGRGEMEFLARWLREKKVKRILKVIVDDDPDRPHSDEAIENSLKHFDVEILDWRKEDMCPGLLNRACKNLRRIYLKWSGNNTALRAWSEPEGLPMLKELKFVHLQVSQGLESQTQMDANIVAFEQRLRRDRQDIQVYANSDGDAKFERLVTPSEQRTAVSGPGGHDLQSHRWLRCIDAFADQMQNLSEPPTSEPELKGPIMVALIDDGVNNCHPALRGKIHSGMSFHRGGTLPVPYYVSSTGHGTVMASMICRVCPTARLQVFKLDTYQSEDNVAQITAKSAAQAIEAAVARKVHVVSMSWTIQETNENGEDIRRLETALRKAHDARILLVCSASDRGAHPDLDYPAKYNVNRVVRIGAATADGRAWAMAGDPANMDFILPGHNVLERGRGPSSYLYGDGLLENFTPRTGSSVATALAAGLAALIMHCARLAAIHSRNQGWGTNGAGVPGVTIEDYLRLRNCDVMKAAMKGIGTSDEGQHKFVEVWKRFDTAAEKLRSKPDERIEYIAATLGPSLVPSMEP